MQKEILESLLENKLSVIASRPLCGRLQLVLSFLEEYGIKQNKKIFFYNMEEESIWYTMKFISFLSGIENDSIRKFYYPLEFGNKVKLNFDQEKLIKTVEKIRNSSIFMEDFNFILEPNTDIVDYFFNQLDCFAISFDFILLNSLDAMVEKSKYTLNEILKRFYEYAKYENTPTILLSNVKRSAEEKERYTFSDIEHYKKLKGFASHFILGQKPVSSSNEIMYKIRNNDKIKTYSFTYDLFTNQIKEKMDCSFKQ